VNIGHFCSDALDFPYLTVYNGYEGKVCCQD